MTLLNVRIVDDAETLALEAAEIFARAAGECVRRRGRFTVALSGGTTPRALHRKLAREPFRSKVAWDRIHVFWVDERCVPACDPASNHGNAKRDLLDHVPIPPLRIHPMPADLPPARGARVYQDEIKSVVRMDESGRPVFDLVILGIGEDGHTASLFPNHPALDEARQWVVAVKGGKPLVDRLTLTLPVLNRSERIICMACGENKAAIIKTLFEQKQPLLPMHYIRPASGILLWLLDRAAASLISPDVLNILPAASLPNSSLAFRSILS